MKEEDTLRGTHAFGVCMYGCMYGWMDGYIYTGLVKETREEKDSETKKEEEEGIETRYRIDESFVRAQPCYIKKKILDGTSQALEVEHVVQG